MLQSILTMDNEEKHFVYFSVSSPRVKNLHVAYKVTLTTDLSSGFSSFLLSHSLNSLTYFSDYLSDNTLLLTSFFFLGSAFVNPKIGQLPVKEYATQNKVKCSSHNNPLNFVSVNYDTSHQCILAL